jgi:hypothetical protein
MSFAAVVVIGLGVLAALLLILFELAQILGEGGPKLLVWPRLTHGYEVAPVTRLAVSPWVLLLLLFGANGACILLFGHDLLGAADRRYVPWLAAALVPLAIIHLIDYQRSVVAAAAAFALLTAGSLYAMHVYDAWGWLPAVLPFLLWSLNGVRALHADRSMG